MSEEQLKSRYNSALPQLFRVDNLWQDTHSHAREINYSKYNEDLDRVWMEFEDDATDDQKKDMKNINKEINKLGIYGSLNQLKKINPQLHTKLILLQKEKLMEKEAILRALQNKSGKGTAYEDKIEDYMD